MAQKSIEEINENMSIWERNWETNPDITTKRKDGAKLHSIPAYTQIEAATKEWGPFGIKWGIEPESVKWGETSGRGAKKFGYDGKNEVYDDLKEITLQAIFYFPGDDGAKGRIPMKTDCFWVPGDDCYKKAETKLITKCLSYLGYNYDVFRGWHDDPEYKESYKAREKDRQLEEIEEKKALYPEKSKLVDRMAEGGWPSPQMIKFLVMFKINTDSPDTEKLCMAINKDFEFYRTKFKATTLFNIILAAADKSTNKAVAKKAKVDLNKWADSPITKTNYEQKLKELKQIQKG